MSSIFISKDHYSGVNSYLRNNYNGDFSVTAVRRDEINEFLVENSMQKLMMDFITTEERDDCLTIWTQMSISFYEAFFIWFLRENKIKTI